MSVQLPRPEQAWRCPWHSKDVRAGIARSFSLCASNLSSSRVSFCCVPQLDKDRKALLERKKAARDAQKGKGKVRRAAQRSDLCDMWSYSGQSGSSLIPTLCGMMLIRPYRISYLY